MLKKILLALALCAGMLSAVAQSRKPFYVELGSQNKFVYELSLGKHWGINSSAGFGPGIAYYVNGWREGLRFDASEPMVEIAPRWYLASESASPYYRSGMYIGATFSSQLKALRFFNTSDWERSFYDDHFTIGFAPTLGWIFPLTEKSYLRTGVALGAVWQHRRNGYGYSDWQRPSSYGAPIRLEIVYGICL